jgi:hypothetical protein
MFSSYNTTPLESLPETPARSSPPWVWVGFIFVVAFLIGEFAVVLAETEEGSANAVLTLIAIGGFIYWLFCIHRFHKILYELSSGTYPVGTSEAVWKHIIPIINIIWIFQWPRDFARYLTERGRVRIISGTLISLLILISLLLRFFDGAIGLACLFGVTLYMSSKLKSHMQSVKGMESPPVPDPGVFQAANPVADPGAQQQS